MDNPSKTPFRKDFIRWYDLMSIVVLSLFANYAIKDHLGEKAFVVCFRLFLCFVSALLIYRIHSILDSKWEDQIIRQSKDPIGQYNASFVQGEIVKLYLHLAVAALTFILFVAL